ncbi:bactericidal permeability-increasing protein-like [Electrophorus electricus]|uniref:bactericidal permeability-increasing protein-like n=1 Tax=Electrophorus electricus TaxID=8005 RepID=UPI0015D0784C|nr:bactericidal permeability-increasing protein-like [Electrophorus electricus]
MSQIEYTKWSYKLNGQKIGIPILLKKLKAIDLPEMSGSVGVFLIGRVAYSLTGMKVLNVRLPQSAVGLVPGIGVSLIISDGYIDTGGNWRVKFLGFISDSGTFDLSVCGLTITTTITIKSDGTGRPMVRSANCEASLSHARIRLRGGIAKQYPNMMMKLLVKAATAPTVTFAPNNVTLQANTTVTVYAIQPNTTLTTLFILNVDASLSAHVYVIGKNLAGKLSLNKFNIDLGTSYIGPFKVKPLASFLQIMLKIVIPHVNVILQRGFPLPNIANISLVKPRLVIMKDYVLIGTDVQFKP